VISIDTLPDDALLDIFDHYLFGIRLEEGDQEVEKAWQSLVHVCGRWRWIVFKSPRGLDLSLVCTSKTPVADRIDVWPNLPLIIRVDNSNLDVDDIIAALERTDRVCQVDVRRNWASDIEIFFGAMQRPFPKLTNLCLWSYYDETRSMNTCTDPDPYWCAPYDDQTRSVVIPDSFLGGSAPRLEHLMLNRMPFPGLLKFLLSATHLQSLHLRYIPPSGYFPPHAIATVLPTLTNLNSFRISFLAFRFYHRASRRSPPSTRSVLPVLTEFQFVGRSDYLDDLVTLIDAPQLKSLHITFLDYGFDTPQLIQFITRTPNLKALEKADIYLQDVVPRVDFSSQTSRGSRDWSGVIVKVRFGLNLHDRLLFLEEVCTSCLPPLSMLEDLYFWDKRADWEDNVDKEPWVELLRPFSAVKNLYLFNKVASSVALALHWQGLVEGRSTSTDVLPTVLPTLQNIFVEGLESSGSVQDGIRQFVAARQLKGHFIAVSPWSI
jgi:hypothetical protein